MNHSFSVDVAVKVGVSAAILLEHISFFCEHSRSNGRHEHDGRFWMYDSARSMHDRCPYMSESTVRRAIEKLVNDGYVLVGKFNDEVMNNTNWYTLTDEGYALLGQTDMAVGFSQNDEPQFSQIDEPVLSNRRNGLVKSTNPIYSISTVNSTVDGITPKAPESGSGSSSAVRAAATSFITRLNELTGKRYRVCDSVIRDVKARLADGYSEADLLTVADNMAAKWLGDPKMAQYVQPSTLLRASKFDGYLNSTKPTTTKQGVDWSAYDF